MSKSVILQSWTIEIRSYFATEKFIALLWCIIAHLDLPQEVKDLHLKLVRCEISKDTFDYHYHYQPQATMQKMVMIEKNMVNSNSKERAGKVMMFVLLTKMAQIRFPKDLNGYGQN